MLNEIEAFSLQQFAFTSLLFVLACVSCGHLVLRRLVSEGLPTHDSSVFSLDIVTVYQPE